MSEVAILLALALRCSCLLFEWGNEKTSVGDVEFPGRAANCILGYETEVRFHLVLLFL